MKLYFLVIVLSGYEEVNIDSAERQSREDRWNRFIKFVRYVHAFVCVCVSALTEGEYMCLILIKGSSFSLVE